jgi:hypothetical protein
MDSVEENITKWDLTFNTYMNIESKCLILIKNISEIKTNLKKLIGNQKKDDIVFYRSLVENSFFYLTNSLKIRKIKFLKDINYVYNNIDKSKNLEELNKSNFASFLKDYRKLADDINQAKKNSTALTWVKDDQIESLHEIEKDMNEIMNYHLNLINFFFASVELEKIFYCGK